MVNQMCVMMPGLLIETRPIRRQERCDKSRDYRPFGQSLIA